MNTPSPQIRDRVTAIIDDEGSVLLDLDASRYYSLNAIGARIWQGLQQGLGAVEIEQSLRETYGVDAARVHEDVARFMASLSERGLIVWR
jgi:hypothetical protein